MLTIGDKVKNFCLTDENEKEVCLNDFKGKWLVIYFYPKDSTSGCTREAIGFTENLTKFKRAGAIVIGISPDSSESHTKFIAKHELKHILLSDPEHKILDLFGCWQLKKLYGREYYGVVRSTFLVEPKGKIVKEWRKVRVNGHVEEVLNTLKELKKS